ncbi:M81 family metallopeptidase [Roseomonas elaeocarpi]|uniref:M81 family metallopeptidase n=1 Tax=Roseomonas elaeocarpi TaxID=907779 RepID=A0ABV6JT14_9PROT
MQRVAILGFRHEAMIACPFLTDPSTANIWRGAEILDQSLTTLTGLTDRFAREPDMEVVPLLMVRTLPGGAFARDFYDAIKQESLDLLRQHGPFDGIVVANHGAAEVEGLGVHGDTDYVVAIRAAVGPDVPIAIPFDMHGQVTPELLGALTVMSCLRTAPHRDNYETSWRAADQLVRVMRTGLRPRKMAVNIPIFVPGEKSMTSFEPARELFGMLPDYDARPGVVEAHLFVGFGWNDLPWCGMKAVVLTEESDEQARDLALEIAERTWAQRHRFGLGMETADIRDGLLRARDAAAGPVLLSDSGDNTTAGAGGDLCFVLEEALDLGLVDIVVAGIFAPEVVAACQAVGEGAALTLEIGRHISAAPQPRTVEAVVEALGDRVDVHRFQNLRGSDGAWARVRIGGVVATFHAARVSFTGPGHLEAVGIDPLAHKITVVKVGYLHPAQEDMAARHICLLSPGVADLDFLRLRYEHIARPSFPMDGAMEWTPSQGLFGPA